VLSVKIPQTLEEAGGFQKKALLRKPL
jgi:hypothetical protein